jgi:hypothetical protein
VFVPPPGLNGSAQACSCCCGSAAAPRKVSGVIEACTSSTLACLSLRLAARQPTRSLHRNASGFRHACRRRRCHTCRTVPASSHSSCIINLAVPLFCPSSAVQEEGGWQGCCPQGCHQCFRAHR